MCWWLLIFCVYTEFFRITINITSVPYNEALASRSSVDFQELADAVSSEVDHIYRDIPGQQTASVLQFRSVVISVSLLQFTGLPSCHTPMRVTIPLPSSNFSPALFFFAFPLFSIPLSFPFYRFPSLSFKVRPFKYNCRVWENAVMCPSGVWGRVPAEIEFDTF